MKPFVQFDDENCLLTTSAETIPYEAIEKISVLNEDAAFKGRTKPFSHQVLGGTTIYSIFGEPQLYVGLKIRKKDGTISAIYVSDRKTTYNTDIYREDTCRANELKQAIENHVKRSAAIIN